MSMTSTQKAVLGIGGALYLVLAVLVTLYLSAAFFCIANKRNPLQVHWSSYATYWTAYRDDPAQQQRLIGSLIASGGLSFLLVPLMVYAGTRKQRPLHGDARFASSSELQQSGLLKGRGILVGQHGRRYLALDGQQFVLLAAPTRSGKGVGVVVPNLLNWTDSVVTLDIKGENYRLTAGFRALHGQQVFAFQPFDESGRTHRYNPLGLVRKAAHLKVGDLQTIAASFYPTGSHDDGEGGSSKFWNEKARDLFVALALYLIDTPELPLTIGELLRQSSGRGKTLKEYLQQLIADRERSDTPLSDACIHALDRFLANPDNTLGNILSTFTAPLTIFADPIVDAATSACDFSLEKVREERMSVYLIIPPPKLPVAGVLINLFFSQLVALNTRTLPGDDPRLRYQCLLLMDEFTAMGRVSIMSKGVGYLAGYNLRFLTIIQSMSQLAGVYGREEAKTFASNHALQILYAPKEQSDAQEYSDWLGKFTEKAHSTGRSRHIIGSANVTTSTTVSDQGRALMLPQELRELGLDREIVMLENCKPILCSKIVYYRDPVFTQRIQPSPDIPVQDLSLHRARTEKRKRPATAEEINAGINLDALALNTTELPTLAEQATPEQVSAYVDEFFKCFDYEPANTDSAQQHTDRPSVAGLGEYTDNYRHIDIDLAELEF